ncbi:hypothetical protein CPB83DRAFT_873629 [Crepidotus variabilis]|uniref:DNA repair protein REV1 n=1 Tax=Crepidotus variabilis TaxID=179855 RepID=A0A9P6ERD4_9AGAR|nr:hypothetical protein CPB83DRAFT_873629 [Crepidotus variabilis]
MSTVAPVSQSSSDYYYGDDNPEFLKALENTVLPGDVIPLVNEQRESDNESSQELEPPPPGQPPPKRKWSNVEPDSESELDVVQVTGHADAEDDTYGASHFGEFGDYMRRKRAKLQVQNSEMAGNVEGGSKSELFKGLAIYINGWTKPSVQDLRQLIVQHGGIFQPYLVNKGLVTHIITCSLTPAKVREFKHMKVAKPEWLLDSVEQGTLLPWTNYIYVSEERIETTQGARGKQATLFDQPSSSSVIVKFPSTASSAFLPSRKPPPAPDALYTTDPVTKADAARIPGYAADKSNLNAQRVMADPEWRKANTSASSTFIEGYYKNSRLHHLSIWKAELKDLVSLAQEQAELSASSPSRVPSDVDVSSNSGLSMRGKDLMMRSLTSKSKWKGKGKAADEENRVIMHCDFDCFFVAAGLVSRPQLKGRPVVVCHSQGNQGGASSTSEIASSSYEARKFGIKNGMSLQQAKQLCPEVQTIPYEFERYKEYSLLFYTVLMACADDLEAVSVDEALIDVSLTVNELRKDPQYLDSSRDVAKEFADKIRAEVRKATTCEISIGISHNILLARLATRRAKPGGSYHLTHNKIAAFLAPLDICDVRGFGWSTKQKAQEKLGTTVLGELATKSKGVLIDALGKVMGETLYNAVRGIDDKKLESDKPRKSVSCEINYGIRFEDNDQAETFIRQMATEVKKRLDAVDMLGRSITLKIMKRDATSPVEPPKFLGHGACDLFNKQTPLIAPGGRATNDEKVIGDHAWRLLKSFNFDPKELRGIGIQIQKLESSKSSMNIPSGQVLLSFKSKPTPRIGTSKDVTHDSMKPPIDGRPHVAVRDPVKPVAAPPRELISEALDLPSFSQVDKSVFDALPRDVREELEQEYQRRRSASPFTTGAGPTKLPSRAPSAAPSALNPRRSATPGMFPENPGAKGTVNVKRITQQLAPRSRSTVSPGKSALYAWAMKPKKQPGIKITEQALRDLNLDPEVFYMLPVQVQSEQLTMARILRDKGSIPEPPKERKVLKAKKPVLPPDFVPYIPPRPKARHPSPPFLRQQGKNKGEKLYFTETDDVQRVVETWVNTYNRWAPRDKDVEFLSKYLVQSVDRKRATDVGVERAIAVMKWWMVLLRRLFPASEIIDEEDELDLSQRNLVGEAWWAAFDKVKDQMDEVTTQRFGGGLAFN